MALIQPLDLERIFVVNVAGSIEIFSFLALVLIGLLMGKSKFNNIESMAMFALFGVIMSSYLPGIYLLVNLVAGIVSYYALSKFAR